MSRDFELRAITLPVDVPTVVAVWEADLTVGEERVQVFRGWLSDHERERAARFHFERDRRRFTVARGLLRQVLGERLGIGPADVGFRVGPHGKPALVDPSGLCFNVSHSGDRALFAVVASGSEVGVDLESAARLGDARELPALAVRTLTSTDLALWRALPTGEQSAAFLRAWTRIEAHGKATGMGLGHVLGKISVLAGGNEVSPGWRGWDLPLGEGWAGAIVVGSPSG